MKPSHARNPEASAARSDSQPGRRIYLDLDDVLAETTRRIVEVLNARFDRRLPFDALTCFDLGRAFDLDPGEHQSAMASIHEPAFLESLIPRDGALEQMRAWAGAGDHLSVVTGRPPDTHTSSQRWLDTCQIPHHSLQCVDKYGRHADAQGRIDLESLRTQRFELAIEDSLEMAAFLAQHSSLRVLLMDRPWNRDTRALDDQMDPELRARIVRVRDWTEIGQLG